MNANKLGEYLQTGEFSDITIVCGDLKIKAHKLVLSCESDYFKAMLSTKNGFKESAEPILNLEEEDPTILQAVINFIYTKTYQGPRDDNELILAAKAFNVALYYQLPKLQKTTSNSFATMLKELDTEKIEDQKTLVDAIRFIYDYLPATRHPIKRLVVNYAVVRSVVLRSSTPFMDLLRDSPYAADVYTWMSECHQMECCN
ncbi:BTB/POZ domain-containing protein [Phyllosticta citriasiana]|uniref:BTB/POZ domain-containing protein n=1 Tax=Phyllosticta citriasiana TaxID=595635 RepID=A0ABR1KK34_9PEZI